MKKIVSLFLLFGFHYQIIAKVPVWSNNYFIETKSENREYTLITLPKKDINKTDGIGLVVDGSGKLVYSFNVKDCDGALFFISNTGKHVFKVNVGVGYPISNDPKECQNGNSKVFVYEGGKLVDSMTIDYTTFVYPLKQLNYKKSKLSFNAPISVYKDTLSILTCRNELTKIDMESIKIIGKYEFNKTDFKPIKFTIRKWNGKIINEYKTKYLIS